MSLHKSRKYRKLLVGGFLALLVAVLLNGLHLRCSRSGEAEERDTILRGHTFPVQALAFSADGTTVTSAAYLVGDERGGVEVTVWDVETSDRRSTRTAVLGELFSLSLNPSGQTLAFSRMDRTVWLWDVASSPTPRRLGTQDVLVTAQAFPRSGGLLATADQVGRVTLWDWVAEQPRACSEEHALPVLTLAFAPDGAILAGGSMDGCIRLWDVATGKEHKPLREHSKAVQTVAYAPPDGRILASGDCVGVVHLWDLPSGRKRATMSNQAEDITAVTFAPDGRTLAIASGPTIELWDVVTEKRLVSLEGHEGKVLCLAYSPDGTRLASGSHDRTVWLWDVTRYR
jgi:WD40 repeat protein